VDGSGNVFVGDEDNNNVQKFAWPTAGVEVVGLAPGVSLSTGWAKSWCSARMGTVGG